MAPERIVSLVPSLTELVVWLGAGDSLVGRTRFCSEPAGTIERVPVMGGTKNPNVGRIIAAAPDLIIANKEENRRDDIEALTAMGLNVLLTDPNSITEAVEMILDLGRRLELKERAAALADAIKSELAKVTPGHRISTYVGVWHNPMMGLGSDSYGHSLLEACGGRNVLRERPRYPELTMEELRQLKPEVTLLPDEPFPFDAGHAAIYSEVAPTKLVDGKLLWWYGPRMPEAIRVLSALIHEASRR